MQQPKSQPDLSVLRMERNERPPVRVRSWRAPIIAIVVLAVLAGAFVAVRAWWLVPEVETTTVQLITPTQASTVLTATGYTYARERAAVGAKIIGRVVRLPVEEGDRVRAGAVIAGCRLRARSARREPPRRSRT